MYSVSDLETFIAIVENKGIFAAATVSHRLAKLERELATVLVLEIAGVLDYRQQVKYFIVK